MASLPPAIFFINGDIQYPPTPPIFVGSDPNNVQSYVGPDELTNLQQQLFIDDTMTKAEFDARVAADPNYPTIVHLQLMRILVILPTFQDEVNRELADVVMFLHQGLADIECNRFGPPRQDFPFQRINMYELLRAVGSHNVVILPWDFGFGKCDRCYSYFFCDCCHTFSGMRTCPRCTKACHCGCTCNLIDNQGRKFSEIHLPNCENEAHNPSFIHRK